ncbi:hypothetical protein AB0942_09035 [Streptomyces nodosus]
MQRTPPRAGARPRPLLSLTGWAERHRVAIAEARASYDAEHRPEPLDA